MKLVQFVEPGDGLHVGVVEGDEQCDDGANGDDDGQASEMAVPAEPFNTLLWRYMAVESSVLRTLQIPIGVTLLAIARKS